MVKKFGKCRVGSREPDGQGTTYTESSLWNSPSFQQGLASLVTGTATRAYMVAEAGTPGDDGRQVSSFGNRALGAALGPRCLLPGTKPSC